MDHYFVFIAIGYAFLVFPRKEKGSMATMIVSGLICYLAILVLYKHVEPVVLLDQSALALQNQVLLYMVFILFIIFMISARNFPNKTEDSLNQDREKLAEMAALLKKMFGRYLSTEVMTSLIENPSVRDFYGKVIERSGKNERTHVVRFTSVPSEVDAYFQSHRQHAAKPTTGESS